MYAKLLPVVKAVRLRFAVPLVLLLAGVYWMGIHPWLVNWGSTPAEQQMALPGDDLYPGRIRTSTQAITINAPAGVVWQWLAQIGQDRAGFYSYTWLENIFGANIHNANEVHAEWQHLAVGEGAWRMLPEDYLGGVGKTSTRQVLMSEPGHALVLEMWGAYVLVPVDAATTRLIIRGEPIPEGLVTTLFVEPMVYTMNKRMLLGLKARAESRPDAPAWLLAIAWFGWAAAGISVAGLFLRSRSRWPWLALPIAAALPAVLMSRDLQAGLAAFIAAGIVLLGFLNFGKDWWGACMIIGSTVLLTLLLVPEAFSAIGLAFALLLLAAVGMAITRRRQPSEKQIQTAPGA